MLPSWMRLSSPEGLRPVVGLYYLLLDPDIHPDARRDVEKLLGDLNLEPADTAGSFADAEDHGAVEGIESDADRPPPPAGKKARLARSADGDPALADGGPADSEPMGVEPDAPATPSSLWRATRVATDAESASLLATARAKLRGAPGVRYFNPVYSPTGNGRQGHLTYGPRVLVAAGSPSELGEIRSVVQAFGLSGADVQSLVDLLPAGSPRLDEVAEALAAVAAVWVVAVPELSRSTEEPRGAELTIMDGDALALARLLDAGASRSAVPDWIQLDAAVGQGPTPPGVPKGKQAADWWADLVSLPELLRVWTDRGQPAPGPVAVLDGGFDLDLDLEAAGLTFANDMGYGRVLDRLFARPAALDGPYRAAGRMTHGTQVASVVAGNRVDRPRLAPDGVVLPMRIGKDAGNRKGEFWIELSDEQVALGILGACALGAAVIAISFSTSVLGLTSLALVVAELVGVPVVAATGNYSRIKGRDPEQDPDADIGFPSRWPTVLSVGGYGDDTLAWAEWPAGGPNCRAACWRGRLDVAAPAIDIAAVRGADGTVDAVPGTSFAAPIVAGGIALLRALHPRHAASTIRDALRTTADLPDPPPAPDLLGAGGINLMEAHRLLDRLPPEENNGMNGSPRRFDWLTLLVGLALGMAFASLMMITRGGGSNDPATPEPTEVATPSGPPHEPLPTIHGDVSWSGCPQVSVQLSKSVNGKWSPLGNPVALTVQPAHYYFTGLTNGDHRVTATSACNASDTVTSPNVAITSATDLKDANLNVP